MATEENQNENLFAGTLESTSVLYIHPIDKIWAFHGSGHFSLVGSDQGDFTPIHAI